MKSIRVIIKDAEALKALTPEEIRRYMEYDGWTKGHVIERPGEGPIGVTWSKSQNGTSWQIVQHTTDQYADYPYRVKDVIVGLCEQHGHENELAIYNAIKYGASKEHATIRLMTGEWLHKTEQAMKAEDFILIYGEHKGLNPIQLVARVMDERQNIDDSMLLIEEYSKQYGWLMNDEFELYDYFVAREEAAKIATEYIYEGGYHDTPIRIRETLTNAVFDVWYSRNGEIRHEHLDPPLHKDNFSVEKYI